MTSLLRALAERRALARARHAYLTAARAAVLAAEASDDALTRMGTALLALAVLADVTDDPHTVDNAIIAATEWGASRVDLATLFVIAATHLGPALGVGPVTVVPADALAEAVA